MLSEFDRDSGFLVADLEAGIGTLSRLPEGGADVIVTVIEPSLKSIEVAKKVAAGVERRHPATRTVTVANKVESPEHMALIGRHVPDPEIVIPWDRSVADSDRIGVSPLDVDPESPAVTAVGLLADLLEAELNISVTA